MPTIDLFNIAADDAKIDSAIEDGTFRFRSKLFLKTSLKVAAQSTIVAGVVSLAVIGAVVVIAVALTSDTEEETE